MNAIATEADQPVLAVPFGGGFFVGRIRVDDEIYGLVVSPKSEGEIVHNWNDSYKNVVGATSWNDGLSNTKAMADAGSKFAEWALGLNIAGYSDWYIPAVDEKEIIYRALKPTTRENSLYARSGINVSAFEPTYPYTKTSPAQTQVDIFKTGGIEAFESDYYWTSTQHPDYSDCAFIQDFSFGGQHDVHEDDEFRGRVIRRFKFSSLSI